MENQMSISELERKILSKEIDLIFKNTALTYNPINNIIEELDAYKEEAFNLFKDKRFDECIELYKTLLEKCIEHLKKLDDTEGKLGEIIFHFFSYLTSSLRATESSILEHLDWLIDFYISEDLGFSNEIMQLAFKSYLNKYSETLEKKLLQKHNEYVTKNNISRYEKEKVIIFIIKYYDAIGNNDEFFEWVKALSESRWERYAMKAAKLEEMGQLEDALKEYDAGLAACPTHTDHLEKLKKSLEKRILGF